MAYHPESQALLAFLGNVSTLVGFSTLSTIVYSFPSQLFAHLSSKLSLLVLASDCDWDPSLLARPWPNSPLISDTDVKVKVH